MVALQTERPLLLNGRRTVSQFWFEIERGASSEPGVFRPLPPAAEGHRGFTLRFRLMAGQVRARTFG